MGSCIGLFNHASLAQAPLGETCGSYRDSMLVAKNLDSAVKPVSCTHVKAREISCCEIDDAFGWVGD